MQKAGLAILIALLVVCTGTCSVQALNFDQVYIRIEENGDADVYITYELPVWEYFAMLSPLVKPEDMLSNTLQKDVTVLCMGKQGAMLRVPEYAEVNGNTYTTPTIHLAERTQYGPFTTIDLASDIVIVFPDNRFYTYSDSLIVPSLKHVSSPGGTGVPEPPLQTCSSRNLPLSWLVPDELAPLAAIVTGVGVVAIGNAAGSQAGGLFQKLWALLQKFVLKVLAPLISRKEVEKRGLRPDQEKNTLLFGLSGRELTVIAISALVFTVAFVLKDRLHIEGITIMVFILMGGMATVAHELSHRFFARRWNGASEFQFWGLGTTMMLLTAWLFGNVFAKPSRTLTAATEHLTREQTVVVAVAGPLANIVFALASVLLIPLGGLLTLIGQAGLSMNLLAAVFEMVPLSLLDGKKVYAYSKILWAAAFFPLLILYIAIYMA